MRTVLFCAVLLAVLCGPRPALSQPGEETPEDRDECNDTTPMRPTHLAGEGQPAADQAIFAGLDAENVMEDAAAVEAEDRAEDAETAVVTTAAATKTAETESRPNKRTRTSRSPTRKGWPCGTCACLARRIARPGPVAPAERSHTETRPYSSRCPLQANSSSLGSGLSGIRSTAISHSRVRVCSRAWGKLGKGG